MNDTTRYKIELIYQIAALAAFIALLVVVDDREQPVLLALFIVGVIATVTLAIDSARKAFP